MGALSTVVGGRAEIPRASDALVEGSPYVGLGAHAPATSGARACATNLHGDAKGGSACDRTRSLPGRSEAVTGGAGHSPGWRSWCWLSLARSPLPHLGRTPTRS